MFLPLNHSVIKLKSNPVTPKITIKIVTDFQFKINVLSFFSILVELFKFGTEV